ncbi:hypothetical protein OF829_08620 [Sphingomonas sp. LB-2]|uniref:SF0329 family protein n=1 Tax=Sphingomonas caeni TaxID=2984949 RepID=UPI00223079B5|nr:hypothetical protein [Sphingomonas caeni]MCW3847303.1 hypothetical protein [Sphingomonas caeni]
MRWSKLRSLVIERFAAPLQGRLDIHSTRYGNCSCGHAWLTLDGAVVANFCTRAHYFADHVLPQGNLDLIFTPADNPMYRKQLTVYGERSRQQLYRTLWDFVHTIPIEQALASDDMLLQALAIVDARVGKRRLAQLDPDTLHPLCAYLLLVRTGRADLSPAEFIALRREVLPTRVAA